MTASGYPLAALRKLREAEVDERIAALAARTAEESAATTALSRAIGAREGHRDETRRIDEVERALGSGPAAAGARLGAWRARRRAEQTALGDAVAAAERALAAARTATETARSALAAARAEVAALEKHRARWEEERRRQTDRRAEAELDDLAARRGRS